MGVISKFRLEIGIFLLLSITYFISRLTFLTGNPIFTDEAIYLRWAQIAVQDPAWTFISLTDGKQPLFIWLVMPLLEVFQDPLLAGRIVSVMGGFFSMLGLAVLSYVLFKNRVISILSAFLYLIYPMAYVYDRIAIYDGIVGTFYIYGLLLSVLLIKLRRLDIALLFGFMVGGGLLLKTNLLFSLYLLPFTMLLFEWKEKGRKQRLLKLSGLVILSVVIAFVIESLLRLSPYYYIIGEKNAVFVLPVREWLSQPFLFVFGNLRGLLGWFFEYFNIATLLLVLGSLVVVKSQFREKIVLLLFFLVPFMAFAVFGKVIYPRHIFFMTLPLLPLVAFSLYYLVLRISKPIVKGIVFIALLLPMLLTTVSVIQDYKTSAIPGTDKQQYITSWPSGGGVRESVAFFEKEAQKGPIFIATQGELGLLPYALEIYLDKTENITLDGYWPINEAMPVDIVTKSEAMPTFVVFYQPCPSCKTAGIAPLSWPLEIISQYKNFDGTFYTVYKVKGKE